MNRHFSKCVSALFLAAALAGMMSGCGDSSSSSSSDTEQSSAANEMADSPADAEQSSAAAPSSGADQSSSVSEISAPALDGYNLLWSDEFDGTALDDSIWSYDPHEPGWTNEELQEYTTSTDNVFVRDGKLILKAIKTKDADGKDYYTSGKIKSQGKKDFMYGKVVASAKVPEGQGLWPAIWMMPKEEEFYGQWPKCGEIDIMEVLGSDVKTAYCTLHYGEPHNEQQGTHVLSSGSYADSFHEYSVEWEPGEMRWYIDNELVLTANDWFTAVEGQDEQPYPAPFNQEFFVQMNLAVGGTWPGNPDAATDFDKAEFEVDYVRVYQKDSYDKNVTKPEKEFRKALEDGNYIYNGDFSEAESLDDDTNWKFLLFNGGEGAAEIKDNMIVISSTNAGTEEYSVQLVQPDLPMIKGKKYRVTFDAKADEDRNIIVCVSAPSAGWIRYLPDTTQAITTEMQTYTFDFEMKDKDDNNGRLEFNMGKYGETATVYISNVRVEEVK